MADRVPFARLWGRSHIARERSSFGFYVHSNVHREPIHNSAGDIVGVNILAEVVNTGPVPIISPFIMTWKLRTANSEEIARTTHRFSRFDAGQVQKIALTMEFAPRSNLSNVQNVVTFDFEEIRQ